MVVSWKVHLLVALVLAAMGFLHRGEASSGTFDTTLPFSRDTFWRLAQSESFYRESRVQGGRLTLRVLEVGKWALKRGRHKLNPECDTNSRGGEDLITPADGKLQREVRLLSSIVCPLGSMDSHVLQDQILAIEDGVVTYVTVDCVKGLLGMRKDLVVRTTVQVSPKEDNPKAIRASVAVKVGDVSLPSVLRWASKLVERSIRADVVEQSKSWLNLMAKQERVPRDASGIFRGTFLSWLA